MIDQKIQTDHKIKVGCLENERGRSMLICEAFKSRNFKKHFEE